ncbi:MAG: clostripain-related cysteine peptidase [Bacteroidales bacterium]|nr:clostripain-related cysteine peptidase [Bacteroidales bacterium]
MKYNLRNYLCIIISGMLATMASCGDDPEPNPQPVTKRVDRTLLVYMAANNSLGVDHQYTDKTIPAADSEDLKEMQTAVAAGHLGDNRLLVYRSAHDGSDALYEMTKTGLVKIKDYTDGSISVSIARMTEVIDDTKEIAPADNFALVLWSHGNGWNNDGYDDPADKRRTWGEHQGKTMNITALSTALDGQGLEYIYFDCCYMGTVEVAYELRHAAPYIVASASELPRDGMPYDKTLRYLMRGAGSLTDAARITYEHYNAKTAPVDRTCTISVIETAGLDRLARATAAIYDVTPLPHPAEHVTNYRGNSRRGYSIDFGEYVSALAVDSELPSSLTGEFDAALSAVVKYAAATERLWDDYVIYNHSGLATYVFNTSSDYETRGYRQLEWAVDVVSHHMHD